MVSVLRCIECAVFDSLYLRARLLPAYLRQISGLISVCALRYLCVAGRVESWTVLCDCAGTSFSSFPLGLLLRLLKLFQASYRGRMHKFYLLNTPRFFQTLSRPLLSALPRSSARKLRVFGSFKEWSEERKQTYARHQLEVKYGGTQPDIEKVL